MSSGLIYAVIVGAWAAVLIPMWLRRHDARVAQRSTSPRARVLVRADGDPAVVRHHPRAGHAHGRPARAPASRRRSLTARRRRLLLTLLVLAGALSALAASPALPAWPAYAAGLLVVGYVVHLRAQARRDVDLARSRQGARQRLDARMRRVDSAERVVAVRRARDAERALERARAVAEAEELAALEEAARVATAQAEEGWEPRTAPLPTYVSKPKASRPARSIDLSAGRVWVSPPPAEAPPVEPGEPVAPAAMEQEAAGDEQAEVEDVPQRRAVND